MTQKKLIEELSVLFSQCLIICNRKNSDYAKGDTDAFSNFAGITSITGIPTDYVFLQFVSVKVLRIAELLKKEAKCESLNDSLKDLINYASLYYVWRNNQK